MEEVEGNSNPQIAISNPQIAIAYRQFSNVDNFTSFIDIIYKSNSNLLETFQRFGFQNENFQYLRKKIES